MKLKLPDDLYENVAAMHTAPDRFWRRVLIKVQKEQVTRPVPGGDNLMHECCRFARRWSTSEPEQYDTLYRDFPTIMPAFMIYDNQDGIKWYVEAGLTSDAAVIDISQYVGESTQIINRYAQLFYNVADWLDAEGCIAANILRPRAISFSPLDSDFLYKTLAYAYGWDTFKAFVGVKELTDQQRSRLQATFRDALLKNGWLAAHKLRLNNYNALETIARCLDLDTLKVQEEGAGAASNQVRELDALRCVLDKCGMNVLPAPDLLKPAELPASVEVVTNAD